MLSTACWTNMRLIVEYVFIFTPLLNMITSEGGPQVEVCLCANEREWPRKLALRVQAGQSISIRPCRLYLGIADRLNRAGAVSDEAELEVQPTQPLLLYSQLRPMRHHIGPCGLRALSQLESQLSVDSGRGSNDSVSVLNKSCARHMKLLR